MQEYPSYGYLIDLLEDVEKADENADILSEKFAASYPHIPISRPSRFLDTVRRLAAPTRQQKLMGSPLIAYRRRHWMPRNRRQKGVFVLYITHNYD